MAISALTVIGLQILAADLYLYLISQPEYRSPDARRKLLLRLIEAMVQSVSIVRCAWRQYLYGCNRQGGG
ncbi:hypothetical protein GQ43DRAFT_496508 [Delitschia confertaspora ATCC 74209]|uniref:Uncharacterized protein n=1 Tax=Delitschia confertaspora ATCC 74209 TaxID=1513339 RepID=A0A9P4JIG5_9PLEO|nr:hypothetical protein GQ43DRAFT_496508 [Delitschia confertaspora ATCC 74209]